MFLANGYPLELIERFVNGVDEGTSTATRKNPVLTIFNFMTELDKLSVNMYLRYHHSWGRRVTPPAQPTPPEAVSVPPPSPVPSAPLDAPSPVQSSGSSTTGRSLEPGPNATLVVFDAPGPAQIFSSGYTDDDDVVSMSISSASSRM